MLMAGETHRATDAGARHGGAGLQMGLAMAQQVLAGGSAHNEQCNPGMLRAETQSKSSKSACGRKPIGPRLSGRRLVRAHL